MEYRRLGKTDFEVSVLALGTWPFSSDRWWGHQETKDSEAVLEKAIQSGMTTWDTAAVYGRGHAETVIGNYLKQTHQRDRVFIATKLGLSWEGKRVFHCLTRKRMFEEMEASRQRLQTDVFDLYQVHWPDPETPIQETAETMHEFYQKGWIRAIGVSNYSVEQMKEFMKYAPLHTLQPPYNMFRRGIEEEILPFCQANDIATLVYSPLCSGILTGKFFFFFSNIPTDLNRKDHIELKKPRLSLNREIISELKDIAGKHGKGLAELVLRWTSIQKGVTCVLVGARKPEQILQNRNGVDWDLGEDIAAINKILKKRESLQTT